MHLYASQSHYRLLGAEAIWDILKKHPTTAGPAAS